MSEEFDLSQLMTMPEDIHVTLLQAFVAAESLLPLSRRQQVLSWLDQQVSNWSAESSSEPVAVPREVANILLSAYSIAEPHFDKNTQKSVKTWMTEYFSENN